MKLLKERLPNLVDEALGQHTRFAEGWAGNLRLFFAGMFFSAGFRSGGDFPSAKSIYISLAVGWLILYLIGKIWAKPGTDSKVTIATLLDFSLLNLGLLLFTSRGLFADFSTGLYLSYYPLLAIAATRYRPTLVITAALLAMVFYVPLSIYAKTPSWAGIGAFILTAAVLAMASRSPNRAVVKVVGNVLQEAYDKGAKAKEIDLTAEVHQLFLPPAVVDLPEIWSSSKHGAGTETGGDYFQIFETLRGPLVAVGDFGGQGFQALTDLKQLDERLDGIISAESSLPKIMEVLNRYIYEKYKGQRAFTCVMAEWQGDEMRYANAGHLPAIRMSKQERIQLPATSEAIGLDPNTTFKEEIVPFLARDLLILYTDGVFAKLTDDREKGIAEIESFAEKFSGGEVNTLCHRIFDCAQPGFEPNKDDSTIVVIRRQPAAAAIASESKA
jgi:hypothetical protein